MRGRIIGVHLCQHGLVTVRGNFKSVLCSSCGDPGSGTRVVRLAVGCVPLQSQLPGPRLLPSNYNQLAQGVPTLVLQLPKPRPTVQTQLLLSVGRGLALCSTHSLEGGTELIWCRLLLKRAHRSAKTELQSAKKGGKQAGKSSLREEDPARQALSGQMRR